MPAARGRRPSGRQMTLRLEEGFPHDLAEWSRLAEASGNVFATPEWLLTWHDHLGGDGTVVTASERGTDGALQALAIVQISPPRRPLRLARFLGHGPSDELGPISLPARRAATLVELRAALAAGGLVDVFLGEQLPGGLDRPAAYHCRLLDQTPCPVLRFTETDWKSFLAGRSANFRQQVRRLERRVLGEGGMTIRGTDSERLEADLDALFSLHRGRFGSSSPFVAAERFHRAFARIAFDRGWLRLRLLEENGVPVAVWYGLEFAGACSYYQAGRGPSAPRAAGTMLIAHTVREALEDGLREYRFLRGGESYKYRWANSDDGVQTVATALTTRGRLPVALAGRSALARPRRLRPRLASRAARRLIIYGLVR
jgi:CelD/BcsL family acetyltransferase involved in cellulose biosynthesis